jgi:hypothetical protein
MNVVEIAAFVEDSYLLVQSLLRMRGIGNLVLLNGLKHRRSKKIVRTVREVVGEMMGPEI